ncbi:MAG: asparagine--tRNA ligase [Culicoidibacterales bacterium]
MKVQLRMLQKQAQEFIDKEIIIEGWIRTNRNQSQFGFIQLTDGTFFVPVQVVYHDVLANFSTISKLGVASAVKVRGKVVATPNAKQPIEIQASEVEVLADCGNEYPLQPKRHTREYLREIAHLRPRSNLFQAVFRVRSLAAHAIHCFFQEQDFVYVHTPIITGADAEGAGEMFSVTTLDFENIPKNDQNMVDTTKDFFGKTAGLAVTGQLEAEAFALAFRNVYTFGPTFRAEVSNTTRHASEFWMIEPEVAFADLETNMDCAEAMVKYVVKYVREHAGEEMNFLNEFVDKSLFERLDTLLESEFPRVTYTEAIEILQDAEAKFENKVEWGIDLATEHERYLTDVVYQKPVFLTNYPAEIKAFYMRQNDDGKTVAAMDLLVPGIGELIGGSAREERLEVLTNKMKQFGVDQEELWWYVDINRYGGVKHAGFGMGFERMVMYLTGVENIRDVLPFPRTPKRLDF